MFSITFKLCGMFCLLSASSCWYSGFSCSGYVWTNAFVVHFLPLSGCLGVLGASDATVQSWTKVRTWTWQNWTQVRFKSLGQWLNWTNGPVWSSEDDSILQNWFEPIRTEPYLGAKIFYSTVCHLPFLTKITCDFVDQFLISCVWLECSDIGSHLIPS